MNTDNLRPAAKFFDRYPPRWWAPMVNIYEGHRRNDQGVYMTRIVLTPKTPWGQLYLHIFHRADGDRDFHDHPKSFYTFPLNQGYQEDVFDPKQQCHRLQCVPRRHWTYRPATHAHRVVTTDNGHWPLVTLVWMCSKQRAWGFWPHYNLTAYDTAKFSPELLAIMKSHRFWVPWKRYVSEDGATVANLPGDDAICPGVNRSTLTNDRAH